MDLKGLNLSGFKGNQQEKTLVDLFPLWKFRWQADQIIVFLIVKALSCLTEQDLPVGRKK